MNNKEFKAAVRNDPLTELPISPPKESEKLFNVEPADETENEDEKRQKSREFRQYLLSAMEKFRLGTIELPGELIARIHDILKGYPAKWLQKDSKLMSEALRARSTDFRNKPQRVIAEDVTNWTEDPVKHAVKRHVQNTTEFPPIPYSHRQSMAYIAHRVPGIYGCNYRSLSEVKIRFPHFAPETMLDFGSGPGTVIWAATQHWPSVKAIVAVEPSEHMVNVADKLLQGFPVVRRQYLHVGQQHYYDLVVASYSLSELRNESTRAETVRQLWESVAVGGILVLVEPGTPVGFRIIRHARTYLIDLAGPNPSPLSPKLLAPCPHSYACPMKDNDWCHFIQRIQRTPFQRLAKKTDARRELTGFVRVRVNFENEKYSYIIFSKGEVGVKTPAKNEKAVKKEKGETERFSRLVRQPIKRGGHVVVDACTTQGRLERLTISKSMGAQLFRSARKASWGDGFYLNKALDALEDKKGRPKRDYAAYFEQRKAVREARLKQSPDTMYVPLDPHKLVRFKTLPSDQ